MVIVDPNVISAAEAPRSGLNVFLSPIRTHGSSVCHPLSAAKSWRRRALQDFVLPFHHAFGLLVIDQCVAGLGAHGLLKLFPVFAGDRSPLIQDDLCWQAKVLLPPVDEGFGA